jgi:hypothetical protein
MKMLCNSEYQFGTKNIQQNLVRLSLKLSEKICYFPYTVPVVTTYTAILSTTHHPNLLCYSFLLLLLEAESIFPFFPILRVFLYLLCKDLAS